MSTPTINYLPSVCEAERQAHMPKCSVTCHAVMVAGEVVFTDDAGPCPHCAGSHRLIDEFDDAAAAQKALALAQSRQLTYVRDRNGKAGFYHANGKPEDRAKIVGTYQTRMRT